MKELTIEEKAKAYDNIIEKANKMHSENCEACQMCIEELIPELTESEDERIRKELKEFLDICLNARPQIIEEQQYLKFTNWLEKQGEQKETLCDKCKKTQPSHSCQDITELGRCAVEHEQKSAWSEEDEYQLI